MAGGADNGGKGKAIIAGINVTPLVDITLVLLIIFIVTARIIVTPAVPLDLPRAAQSEEVQVVLSVIIPLTGPTLVNGAAADDATLLRRSQEAVAQNRDVRAVINADGGVAHRRVIHTLGVLKQAGVLHVAFGALPENEAETGAAGQP
jgi:biopolymer transport protein ExbD